MSRVYAVYHNKEIVAWSDDIELAEQYCYARNRSDYKYKLKKDKNYPQAIKLVGEVLNDGEVDILVPMTAQEYFSFGEAYDNMINDMDSCPQYILNKLKPKYLDSIINITNEIKSSTTEFQTIDSVALFCSQLIDEDDMN